PGPAVAGFFIWSNHVTEQQVQRCVFDHLRTRGTPGIFAWHPFSGGYRRAGEAAVMKGCGARAGMPGVMVLRGGESFCMELKTEAGRVSQAQADCHEELRRAGAKVAICRGLDETLRQLEQWRLLRGRAS